MFLLRPKSIGFSCIRSLGPLRVLLVLFSFHLSIPPFRYVSFVAIIDRFLLHPVVGPSSSPSNSFVISFIHSAFFAMFLLCPKSIGFSCIRFLVYFRIISSQLWINFLSLFCNVMFCLYCFTLCRYMFSRLSFASTFWLISSSSIVFFPTSPFFFHFNIFQHLSFLNYFSRFFFLRFFHLRFQSNFPSWF